MDDIWEEMAAASAAREAQRQAREHRMIAELLISRGHDRAAAIVAVADYTCDTVDNWNGGQFEVGIAVPAAQFDRVDDAIRSAIEAAARVVVGAEHFSGLVITVQLMDAEPDWQRTLLRQIFAARDLAVPELSAGGADGPY